MADGLVEVDPETVLRVAAELRHASRQYSAAGWRMSTSLPLMPPRFLALVQLTLDIVAGRLQKLAVELELDAAVEAWRMSRLGDAGAGDFESAARGLLADLKEEGRQAWDDLSRESGPEAWIDPIGGEVHVALGVADSTSQLFELARTVSHLDPAYASREPAEAARARQEMIAMATNLGLLLPAAAFFDPEGHRRATEGVAARTLDWNDIQHGDMPRWLGHIGSGIALSWLIGGISHADDPALAGGAAMAGSEGGSATLLRMGYRGLSGANHLPTDTGGRRAKEAASGTKKIRSRIGASLEQTRGR